MWLLVMTSFRNDILQVVCVVLGRVEELGRSSAVELGDEALMKGGRFERFMVECERTRRSCGLLARSDVVPGKNVFIVRLQKIVDSRPG